MLTGECMQPYLLLAAVPAVSSHSRKYWGIIGEYFAMSELLIDKEEAPM